MNLVVEDLECILLQYKILFKALRYNTSNKILIM